MIIMLDFWVMQNKANPGHTRTASPAAICGWGYRLSLL